MKLLQSLGLQTTLITDGSSPINLFHTANGLVGAMNGAGGGPMAIKSGKKKQKVSKQAEEDSEDSD